MIELKNDYEIFKFVLKSLKIHKMALRLKKEADYYQINIHTHV